MGDQCRIGVTGSRNWRHQGLVEYALRQTVQEALTKGMEPLLVVGGCPTGADHIAERYWRSQGFGPLEVYPADWDNCGPECPRSPHRVKRWPNDKHHPGTLEDWCPKAGPRRNQHMISLGMHVLLAFPVYGSTRSGTWSCVHRARQAGVPVVLPDRWQ